MRAVWAGQAGEAFVVRDVQALMPELAYTTVMTTLHRLAEKGLLAARAERGRRAHEYRVAQSPAAHLGAATQGEAGDVGARCGAAAGAAARGVSALPGAARAAELAGAARRARIRRIRCLAEGGATAFCAGLLAPRVYITAGAVAELAPGALDAVLAHEAAHARRRDPLRRLAAPAARDALFYLPLARWWSRRLA